MIRVIKAGGERRWSVPLQKPALDGNGSDGHRKTGKGPKGQRGLVATLNRVRCGFHGVGNARVLGKREREAFGEDTLH